MAKQFRVLKDMSLRKRPDRRCNDFYEWKAGEIFTPPAHMNIKKALERGLMKEVKEREGNP